MVIATPCERLRSCNVFPGYSVGYGWGVGAYKEYHGYRVELSFDSGDLVVIPCDSHDVAMNQAGLIH